MAEVQTWREETDLAEVKKVALAFLEMDMRLTEYSPIVVSHPYSDSGIVGIKGEDGNMKVVDLTKDPAAAKEWRQQKEEQIREADAAFPLFLMVTKPYRMGFLKYAAPFLSEQDVAKILPFAWTSVEAPNHDPNLTKRELVKLFRSIDPKLLMDGEEYERFQSLGDVVTVYRGVTSHNARNVKALSWTLERKTAEWFAHRFGEQGTVYQARIPKESIHTVFLGRNECEVIVDPKGLRDITQVKAPTQAFQNKMQEETNMNANALDEHYQHYELFGKPVLFTDARIDRSTVPTGWHCYDLRHGDDFDKPCTVENFVVVNHFGTVLSPEAITFDKENDRRLIHEGDFLSLDEYICFKDFCEEHGIAQKQEGQSSPCLVPDYRSAPLKQPEQDMTMGGMTL